MMGGGQVGGAGRPVSGCAGSSGDTRGAASVVVCWAHGPILASAAGRLLSQAAPLMGRSPGPPYHCSWCQGGCGWECGCARCTAAPLRHGTLLCSGGPANRLSVPYRLSAQPVWHPLSRCWGCCACCIRPGARDAELLAGRNAHMRSSSTRDDSSTPLVPGCACWPLLSLLSPTDTTAPPPQLSSSCLPPPLAGRSASPPPPPLHLAGDAAVWACAAPSPAAAPSALHHARCSPHPPAALELRRGACFARPAAGAQRASGQKPRPFWGAVLR